MDYEEDLNAPVWDELGDKKEEPQNELSNSFNNLSTGDNATQADEAIVASEDVGVVPADGKIEWRSEDYGTPLKESLLEQLAPQEDTLSEFQVAKGEPEIASPTKDEPLFSGSTYLPLIGDEEVNSVNADPNTTATTNGNRSSGKPQVLFKSARIRRRPLSNSELTGQKITQAKIADPLGEIKKEEEFVDESLEEQEPHERRTSRSNTILEQVNEPLFKLSPKKSGNVRSNDVEEVAATDEQSNGKISETDKKLIKFNIEVTDPVKVGELTSAHVEYTVVAESDLIEGKIARVNRRYTDFRWLYRQLQSNHWGMIIPPPPEKQTVGRFKQDFIENRRFQMERMLSRIANTFELQDDQDFIMFLTSSTFSQTAKKREQATGSAASNDNNDLSEIHISEIELLGAEDAAAVIKNGGIDGESQKRFMSLSFSSLPKYSEADEFFGEQSQNAEILDEKLRQLDKSLELVDSERNELASVTEEFSKTIESLAALEITKKSSDLLTSFAETHRRIKESLERGSLQEALTLGATLDEYIRLLASLKAIFNQRAKLGQYLVIVESELTKKHVQWDKLQNSSNQGNNDKASSTRNEVAILQRRFDLIKKSWQEVGYQIKKQVTLFETEKIKDFRNSMEIYLESAIEAQKEAIELWETFYQINL